MRRTVSLVRAAHLVVGLAWVLAGVGAASAATYNVDRTDDVIASTCSDTVANDCSLRGAIIKANGNRGTDIINVPARIYTLSLSARGENAAATGDLDLTDSVTISGAGAASTIIQACAPVPPATTCTGIDRVFDIDPLGAAITVMISGVTIQRGNPGADFGGGIWTSATALTLSGVRVLDNTSGLSGGGIQADGNLTLTNVTVSGNMAAFLGGGIDNSAATTTLSGATVSGNRAGTDGDPERRHAQLHQRDGEREHGERGRGRDREQRHGDAEQILRKFGCALGHAASLVRVTV